MAMTPPSNPPAVVIDANVLIALCAKEVDKYAIALAWVPYYLQNNYEVYASGVIIAEALYILCGKLQQGLLTPTEHTLAIQDLEINMTGFYHRRAEMRR